MKRLRKRTVAIVLLCSLCGMAIGQGPKGKTPLGFEGCSQAQKEAFLNLAVNRLGISAYRLSLAWDGVKYVLAIAPDTNTPGKPSDQRAGIVELTLDDIKSGNFNL